MNRQDWWAPDDTISPAERAWINTANQIAERRALAAQKRRPDADADADAIMISIEEHDRVDEIRERHIDLARERQHLQR